MKKLIALVLALALVLAVAVASAGTITINRDDSWDSSAEEANATYTPYKVFDAVITTAGTVDAATGALTNEGNVVYTVGTEALANAVNATTTLKAELASDGKYYISRKGTPAPTDAAVLADIKALVDDNPTLFPAGTAVTAETATVTLTVSNDGYYLIKASNGKDAIVQTIGNVTINEKNDYPTIDKKQKKAANANYSEAVVPAEIGSTIYYQVTVHIPADATKAIKVIDTMTEGLTYNASSFAVSPNLTYTELANTDPDYVSGAAWQIQFSDTVVQNNRDTDVVITYTATVNASAIVDEGKENEVTLKYDNGNYVLKDDIDYTTYFAGIYKVDPNDASANMAGVKFDLKDGSGSAVNVTFDSTNGYYVVGGSDNEVETREETVTESGVEKKYYTIKIRGLDNDKTYTLTETSTKAGYNLLNGTVTLTKNLDSYSATDDEFAYDIKALNTFDLVENNKGTQLPSTGGIGTTIFYILGGLLVVGAAVILVARRKASN